MDTSEENRLIADILNGNANAYAVLVNRYQRPIFNMLLRMTGCTDEASDLTQDTFLRAYENLERFSPSRRFFPWLYTIGMNLARDHVRKRRTAARTTALMQQEQLSASAGHVQWPVDLDKHLDAARLSELLSELSVEYREAVILRFHDGLAMKEIGQALGVSTSGAKMRIKRALEQLRDLWCRKADKSGKRS